MVDRGGVPDHPVPAIQKVMSPAWLGMALFGGYVFAAASAFVGFMELGWWWIVVVLLVTFFGTGLLSVIWPFPTLTQSRAWAVKQAHKDMGTSSAESRSLCSAVILELMIPERR
jgi:hypothetical protein